MSASGLFFFTCEEHSYMPIGLELKRQSQRATIIDCGLQIFIFFLVYFMPHVRIALFGNLLNSQSPKRSVMCMVFSLNFFHWIYLKKKKKMNTKTNFHITQGGCVKAETREFPPYCRNALPNTLRTHQTQAL